MTASPFARHFEFFTRVKRVANLIAADVHTIGRANPDAQRPSFIATGLGERDRDSGDACNQAEADDGEEVSNIVSHAQNPSRLSDCCTAIIHQKNDAVK